MNPFNEKPISLINAFENWKGLYPKSYNKNDVDPYTKTRIILMNGTEFEANWFSHQFSRHVACTDIRRDLAVVRAQEKQQQLKISLLKPADETQLEQTIGYEQLAVDLTAELAKREKDFYVKKALDFALLEDFDHLYRYSDLLYMNQGVIAERLVGKYTEIMPARPTISHHRFPKDNVRRGINSKTADLQTILGTMIITAAEQQTMNYYMNISTLATDDLTRKLYEEIALVEEEHVTQYEDLMDANGSWFEMNLWHEYVECYLYWSCMMTEMDKRIKALWEDNLAIEIAHLHEAAKLLQKHENKTWQQVIPNAEFPAPLSLHENIDYVRNIIKNTAQFTSVLEEYENINGLAKDSDFFKYQAIINPTVDNTPSHIVIDEYIKKFGEDYRFETAKNPLSELQCRKCDNTEVGRIKDATDGKGFTPNK